MKLPPDILERLTPELVLRANKLYHDHENAEYNLRQSEWFGYEVARWNELAAKHLQAESPLVILDYGCGTGMELLAFGPMLKAADRVICTDLSEGIMAVCQSNAAEKSFPFALEFRKSDGSRMPVEDASCDRVVVNAVLHHLPDLTLFAKECARVLKPKGRLVVAHEPNADGFQTERRFQWGLLGKPGEFGQFLAESSPLIEAILRTVTSLVSSRYRRRNAMLRRISDCLVAEGLIHRPVRGTELQMIVDVQLQKGFQRDSLVECFTSFDVLSWEVYNNDHALCFVLEKT